MIFGGRDGLRIPLIDPASDPTKMFEVQLDLGFTEERLDAFDARDEMAWDKLIGMDERGGGPVWIVARRLGFCLFWGCGLAVSIGVA
jgi:hypothetical protein